MRSFGRHTRLFASAEEFLQSGHLASTSCLISDVMMPGMSGVEMHDRIIALGYVPPTIFITAFASANLKAKALAMARWLYSRNRLIPTPSRIGSALPWTCHSGSTRGRNGASDRAALKTTSATAH
ncbi:response regulator [Trinickia violacea]|uniref:response regulator n=1 Tax=Trinickia violacea TaxID=2571746 RepID=UPI0020C76845|nr:response regulator [Trinickia violacea]